MTGCDCCVCHARPAGWCCLVLTRARQPGLHPAGLSVPLPAALGLQSCAFPINVFRLSSQADPESAALRKVSAHLQGNWAMLEGESVSTACFSGRCPGWATDRACLQNIIHSRKPLLWVRAQDVWHVPVSLSTRLAAGQGTEKLTHAQAGRQDD